MAKRAKKANGAKKDLTGKRAGKPTKAELRAAAMAVSVKDKKEKLVAALDVIRAKELQRKAINADIQAARETLNAIGLTKRGFDFARRLIELDPEDREDALVTAGLTLEAAGLGKQGDIFSTDPKPDGGNDAFDTNDHADRAGFKAASEGQNADMNPHAPETGLHDAWAAGWMRQTTQHAGEMDGRHATQTPH